ncbi:MAG: hypothetical protein JW984_16295 [Deltaproteobacteria bacterium]|uniref:Capsule polysaccharide biosynthesis protein n=1 Tax=Candidatus Zymogenus saltonus TaxID=2844893 RepID=A0A9D8PSG0_9DELT|nr:hypothetical protein [Candidatus Zymogenus saltonus]
MAKKVASGDRKNLKIIFTGGVSGFDELSWGLSNALKDRVDIESYFLSFNEKNRHLFRSKGVPEKNILELDLIKWRDEEIDIEYIKKIEEKYGEPNLNIFWPSVRRAEKFSHEEELKMFQCYTKLYESIFGEIKPDFIVNYGVASLSLVVLNRVAEVNNIPNLILYNSKVPDRFVIHRGLKNQWQKVDDAFRELKEKGLKESERKTASEFLSAFRNKGLFVTYANLNIKRQKSIIPRIRSLLRLYYQIYRFGLFKTSHLRERNIFMPFEYTFDRLKVETRRRLVKKLNIFDKPNYDEKYVFFPLHVQPEASTLVWAPFFLDQIEIINNISKSVPIDCFVYVKEHPANIGRRKLEYYRELKRNANVRLLSPWENTQDLILNSSIVITITGTVGWEAIIWEKPVITLGNVFYNTFDLVKHVTDYTKMPFVISDTIKDYMPDRELLLKYITANIKESYLGIPLAPYNCNHFSMSEENLKNLANGLANHIDKYYRKLDLTPA